jgi:hypothetical protein
MSGNNQRKLPGLTINTISAGLIKGTNKSYTTSVETACVINGKFGTVLTAPQTNQAVPTTDSATGAAFVSQTDNTACVYVMGVVAAGTIAACQGSIVATEVGVSNTAGAFRDAPQFPTLPDDFCPLGYCIVRTAPGASDWKFGTDN